ncbi:hypothetical protein [Janibacter alittae]|uniref:Capsular polysaccharide biosynthesis protein n=1 Tax=Janibacter alittae TaxID=3115209 RepID=A0ABZ2MGB9_9MICO
MRESGAGSTLRRGLRRHWRIAMAVFMTWTAVATFYVLSLSPQYAAVSVVSIVPDGPEAASSDFISVTASRYAVAMTSTGRLQAIARQTGVSPDELEQSVTIDTTAPSANLRVTATFPDPQMSVSVANAVADNAVNLSQDTDQLSTTKVAPAAVQNPSFASSRWVLFALLLLAGAALAAWIAYLRQRLEPTVQDEADLERVTGVRSLMSIDARVSTPNDADSRTIAMRQAQALQLALPHVVGGSLHQITLVGVGTARGTATAAYLLAKTLARGERVLLIDEDVDATLSGLVHDVTRTPLNDALSAGHAPPLPPQSHTGMQLLAQPKTGQSIDVHEIDIRTWTDFLEGTAQDWDKVVLATPIFEADAEFRQRPLPSSNAVLVVPRGASEAAVRVAARRVRLIHGDLRGSMIFDGPADS